MADKGVGRDQFHLVHGPDGEPATGKPGRPCAKRAPLLGSRSRAAKLWFGDVRVLRGPGGPGPEPTGRG
jgi:hypothetical protein